MPFPRTGPSNDSDRNLQTKTGMYGLRRRMMGQSYEGVEPSPSFLRWGDGAVGSRNSEYHIVREMDVPDEGGRLGTEWETHVPMFDPLDFRQRPGRFLPAAVGAQARILVRRRHVLRPRPAAWI